MKQPLTYGCLPVGLRASELKNATYGKLNAERITLFYKVLINSLTKQHGKKLDLYQWIQISCHHLNKIFGEQKTKEYVDLLEEYGFIEIDPHWYSKEDSSMNKFRSFRIPRAFLCNGEEGKNYIKIPIYDKKAYNAEVNYKDFRFKEIISRCDDTIKRLAHSLKDVYLDLLSPAAKELIRKHKFHLRGKNHYSYLEYLKRINSHDIEWFKRDDYGRFQYTWVNTNKKVNSLLRFKGLEQYFFGEVDIANSQPSFSAQINVDVIGRLLPQALPLIEGIDFNTKDWDDYRSLCLSGQFYEHWVAQLSKYFGTGWQQYFAKLQVDEYGIKYRRYEEKLLKYEQNIAEDKKAKQPKKPRKIKLNFKTAEARDVGKVLFFNVLFKTQCESDEISNCFKNMLPDVWSAFKKIKSIRCFSNPSQKGPYTNLCWIIVKLEAIVMIDTACKDLLDQGISCIVPRHDSILTPEPYTKIVKEIIEKAFAKNGLAVPWVRLK